MKLDLYEGGIRVPAIVRWPGVVGAGRTSDAVCWMPDILPTVIEAAGLKLPAGRKFDGISLRPMLRGGGLRRTAPLYWQYDNAHTSEPNDLPVPKLALREGGWKLLSHSGFTNFELYNLARDKEEKINLAAKEPARLRRMLDVLKRLHSEIGPGR